MLKNEFSVSYAATLQTGLWDNMEILPEREKELCKSTLLCTL
ncbi:hypothetical protein [Kordia aestuariivivens]|nr:hypothetical protein [Kordia aestuariivivens]